MMRSLYIKAGAILAITLICLYGIFGLPTSMKQLQDNFNQNIKLGLDLRGGSQLVVQVQLHEALRAEADSVIERMRKLMADKGVTYGSIDRNEPSTIQTAGDIQIDVKGVDANKVSDFRTLVAAEFQQWNLTSLSGNDFKLNLKPTEAIGLKRQAVERTASTINKRINSLGLSESTTQQRGSAEDAELLIQLPGVDDPARVKDIIRTAAVLELYPVANQGTFQTQEQARAQFNGMLPPNTKLLQSTRGEGWYLVERTPLVRGTDIRNSRPQQNQTNGRWESQFTLSQDAARRFESWTGANVGKQLAIVLDGKVESAPTVESKIGDTGVITATTQQEATDRSMLLTSGSLPASVQFLEERSVGPSLGADSIRAGLMSGVIGLAAVVLVMLVYYKKAGINATVALILNAIILIATLAYFGAVLTLPGIAGIVLLIGMAVDSNVLIFERIREEIKAGKAPMAAVSAGFGKAFWTIFDTHVTTIVSCAILFYLGTTNVKGFAVSLVIGLVANLFTAIFVSRVMFDWELTGKRVEKLSI
jgi:preprotein translocase subunit SecD